jgi:glycosyltransferase involved in cell wall biosynthesis
MTYVARGVVPVTPELLSPAPGGLPTLELAGWAPKRPTLEEVATEAGLTRVEIVEWRDLEHPEAGGSEVHAARIAERWAAAGIDVVVRASRAPGAARHATYDGYRVERPAGRYAVFPTVAAGAWGRRNARPDGVVEVWNGMPFLSPLWSRGPRMVFIHHVHDGMWDLVLPATLARLGKNIERRVAPPLYRRSPVVTLSASSRRTIIELLGLPPDHVSVVAPGVDQRFSPGPGRAEDPLVVAVGRLVGYKRFEVLVDVLVRLRQRVPTMRAVIAGEGSEQAALRARIAALGAESWLQLSGRIPEQDLVELYRQAWVLASTSAFEGWGMTITEAAACGTPAVATRIPGHMDAVHHGSSGLLASGAAEMEEGLAAVLLDGDLRRRLTRGAEERAASLTWDRTALGTLRVLAADARRRRRFPD